MKNVDIVQAPDHGLSLVKTAGTSEDPFVLLDCGDLSVLVSSADILTFMPAQKMLRRNSLHSCGIIDYENNEVPVFSLSKSLKLISDFPDKLSMLVLLNYQDNAFALGCTAIEKIEKSDMVFYPVPVSMSSRKQPFNQVAVIENRAVGLVSADSLWQLLIRLKAVKESGATQHPSLVRGAI